MKLRCASTISIRKITNHGRFSVLKTWSYFCNDNIIVSKMGKSGFYIFPLSFFKGMAIAKTILQKRHRHKTNNGIIRNSVSWIDRKQGPHPNPFPCIWDVKRYLIVNTTLDSIQLLIMRILCILNNWYECTICFNDALLFVKRRQRY